MTQIENGMIVGAEKYDPQCQDIKMQRHRASHLHDIEQSDRDFCLESDNYFDFVRGQMVW